MSHYDPKRFWEDRLRSDFTISGTGHAGFSRRYNGYMYTLKKRALGRALSGLDMAVSGKRVLDIGCGTGFFVDYYLKSGAAAVTGIDITDVSVGSLKKAFPPAEFYRADISAPGVLPGETFDIINAFDVLYHITDDAAFRSAISNIAALAAPGAAIFITDATRPDLACGEHVRYRSGDTYRTELEKSGIRIKKTIGIMCLMGKGADRFVNGPVARRVAAWLIETFAWLGYIIDSIYCPRSRSTFSLMVCMKEG
jgi:SAM-dependent methyltransferase